MAQHMGIMGGVMSIMQANAQNDAIQDSLDTNEEYWQLRRDQLWRRAFMLMQQTGSQDALEQWKLARQAHSVRGRVQALAASAGRSSTSGSWALALKQTFAEESMNKFIMNKNYEAKMEAIESDYDAGIIQTDASYYASVNQLNSQFQNPLFAGFGGFMQGTMSGLNIQALEVD